VTQVFSALDARVDSARSKHEFTVVAPYRLDLTVTALRRLSTNVVDVLTPEGLYLRALRGAYGPVMVRVQQSSPTRLTVTLEGSGPDDHVAALSLVRRMLGIDRDLTEFYRAAEHTPWLHSLAMRMSGLKPPRYPTVWEAFVNAIAFQQLSLQAASAIVRRMNLALEPSLNGQGVPLHMFPSPDEVLVADYGLLRAVGLSAVKVATLRRAADALSSGALSEAILEGLPSADAAALLRRITGIGPWTAAVILLRGLGRLDVFPMNDSSVMRNLALVAGPGAHDISSLVESLRPQQGMLYYHLLLARLESRGEVGRPSRSSLLASLGS
jgi:DNA-3-methyladenine glycosylase II